MKRRRAERKKKISSYKVASKWLDRLTNEGWNWRHKQAAMSLAALLRKFRAQEELRKNRRSMTFRPRSADTNVIGRSDKGQR